MTDTLLRVTGFTYDAADRETVVSLPGNRSVHLGYDTNGNLTRITPPASAASHFLGYTDVDLTQSYTPPGISGVSDPATGYDYTLDRQLAHVVLPEEVVTLSYHGTSGKLEEIEHAQGVNAFTYTSSPISTGQVKTATSADSVIVTYDYDGALLKKETWTGRVAGSVERTFNPWFRDSTEQVNGGSEVTFRYDGDGLLVGAGTLCIQRRTPDGLIEKTLAGVVTSDLSYNDLGELTDLHYQVSGSTYFRQQLYRDALGRIIRIGETVDGVAHSKVYRYDTAGRLDSVAVDSTHVAAYRYDGNQPGNGNRTAVLQANGDTVRTATYDAQDRMLRSGAVGYRYSARGDLAKIRLSDTDSTLFTYDALGNLIRAKPPGHQLDYLSDGENRRVGYQVDGILQRVWLYRNGLNPVAELDRSGTLVSRYVYGTQPHVPDLLLQASQGHGYRVVTDYLGSVRAVVDTSDGTVAQRIDYDAWGVRTTDTAPAFQALGYAGGLTDSATGLVRFGARDYEPGVGRWTAKEPVNSRSMASKYEYAASDPIDLSDHTGMAPQPAEIDRGDSPTLYLDPKPGIRGIPLTPIPPDAWVGDIPGIDRVTSSEFMYPPPQTDVDVILLGHHAYHVYGPYAILISAGTICPGRRVVIGALWPLRWLSGQEEWFAKYPELSK